jgi:Protein of unknown function (DUF2510)
VTAIPGWYPDPGGEPDLYRYWDGIRWSVQTTPDPRHAAPASMDAASSKKQSSARAGLWIAVIALVLIVIVAAVIVVGRSLGGPIVEGPVPSSTVSGWDDSSPTAEPTPSSTHPPTPSPTPSSSGVPQETACVSGQPDARAVHPDDERVYGGNLSFTRATSFEREAGEPRLSFAYDVTQQYLPVSDDPGWIAQLAVGGLKGADGFDQGAKRTALTVVECIFTSEMYVPYDPKRRDLRSQALKVSGRAGWLVETNISVNQPGLPFAGDHVVVVVVEDGTDWGLFFGAVPIGDQALTATLNATVDDLRAS